MRPVVFLLLLGPLASCDRGSPGSEGSQPVHAADSVRTARNDTVQAASSELELEAPRLIPGLRAHLSTFGDSARVRENAAAFRNLAADVVNAMEADLNRAGSPEVDRIRQLGDSVLRTIGGGPGDAPEPGAERVKASVGMMERLIQEYESALRATRR